MTSNSERALEVFTEAIQLAGEERRAFVHRACAGNEVLRQKVEALLRSNDRAGDFLEHPPTSSINEGRARVTVGEISGDQIGRYKLLEQIGEGGCGVVFVAEQAEPVRRRVALKIIKPGMDTKSVIARFEAERQALALMDHPNIAKIFDAGTTANGRPYFVMELVQGTKVTDYCDQHSLSTRQRLKLFVQVCHAVQHAHQKGVIHRDIKPSNILVTNIGDVALPVVIDFGIAKATSNQHLTDNTVFTAFEMLIGTPAYMSPEQASLTSADIDTRSDIYSLGVLLYELLTGSTPFDTRKLLKAGLDEIRRVIREEEPARPSTRLSKLTEADLTTVASHRHSEAPTLIRSMRGDLDWIAMKALEKDRARRYPTANALALDIQRFVATEPVAARPPSKVYKLQKTIQRNKVLSSCIGVIALLLVTSLIVVSSALTKERRSRRDAQSASARSEQIKRFLEDMLQGVEPSVALGQDATLLRGILDRTAERIGKEMTNQPVIEAELRSLIGRLYFEIGNYDGAEMMQRAALEFYRRQFPPMSLETAAVQNDLGAILCRQSKLSEAENVLREALSIRRSHLGGKHKDVATTLNNLGTVYRESRKLAESEEVVREGLAIREKTFGHEHLEIANSLQNLSMVLCEQGKVAEAEERAREVLAMRRRLVGNEHPVVASALLNLASALSHTHKLEEAESLQEQAFAMQRRLLGDEHPEVSASLSSLGDTLRKQGDLKDARLISSAAITMQRRMFGDNSPEVLKSLRNLASTFEQRKKYREAENLYREVLAGWRKRGEGESVQGAYALESISRVLINQRKPGEAEQLLDQVLTPAFVEKTNSLKLLNIRTSLKARRGQWQKAADDAAHAFQHRPADHTRFPIVAALLIRTENRAAYEKLRTTLVSSWSNTTDFYIADQVAKACFFLPCVEADLPILSRLADLPVTHGIKNDGAMPYFEMLKALSEYRQGHYTQSVDWCQKVLARPPKLVHAHVLAILAMDYWNIGKIDDARATLAKGDLVAPREMPAYVVEDSGDDWKAWLYARVQLDEAASFIRSGAISQNGTPR